MRYYIHVFNGSEMVLDPDGDEFLDWDAAVAEATQSARDLAADRLRQGLSFPSSWAVHIADEHGALLKVISLAQLIGRENLPVSTRRSLKEHERASDFSALYAKAGAAAVKSRSIHTELTAAVMNIRAQLRSLADLKFG